jgi:hypothetical protein
MANYYLKNADTSRVYRLVYEEIFVAGTPVDPDGHTEYSVTAAYVCATAAGIASMPNEVVVTEPDTVVSINQVLVDTVINPFTAGTVTDYRTVAKAMIDESWS